MRAFLHRFVRHRPAVLGLAILLMVAACDAARAGDSSGQPLQPDRASRSDPPFGEYLFGTDQLGRDLAAALLYGARTTLLIGLVATAIAVLVGVTIGGLAGYYGGHVDSWLMRLTEIFQTIPFFLFAILLLAVLRLRSATSSSPSPSFPGRRWRDWCAANSYRHARPRVRARLRAMGMSNTRIILRHILPNTLPSIIVTASLMVATAILIESSLSFLGLSDPNVMSWGFIIGAGRTAIRSAWWVCAIPGIAILLTVMSINLVGEGLNDALNPRLRTL